MGKQRDTGQTLDATEKRGRSRLLAIEGEREALGIEREGLLLQLAEGDLAAKAKLEKCDASIATLGIERESIESLLRSLPARRDAVRAEDVEALIPRIEKLVEEIPALVAEIKSKLEPLVSAIRKLKVQLDAFEDFPEVRMLSLGSSLFWAGKNALNASTPQAGVASDGSEMPVDLILTAVFFDEYRTDGLIGEMQARIADRVERMRDHARRLKGEDMPPPQYAYCPNCYENMQGGPDNQGRCHCGKCGKTFAAEKVPGALVAEAV
jgi:hypothetical protein